MTIDLHKKRSEYDEGSFYFSENCAVYLLKKFPVHGAWVVLACQSFSDTSSVPPFLYNCNFLNSILLIYQFCPYFMLVPNFTVLDIFCFHYSYVELALCCCNAKPVFQSCIFGLQHELCLNQMLLKGVQLVVL